MKLRDGVLELSELRPLMCRQRNAPLQHAVGYICSRVQKLPEGDLVEVFHLQSVPAPSILMTFARAREQIRHGFTSALLGAAQKGVQDGIVVATGPAMARV
jgi:hypothetical protein